MDEFIQHDGNGDVEFFLGTVTSYATTGVGVRLDGQNAAMTKKYKMLRTGKPLVSGDRVVIMKMSGTYVVLGAVDAPVSKTYITDLATSASTGVIALRFNSLLAALRAQGIIG